MIELKPDSITNATDGVPLNERMIDAVVDWLDSSRARLLREAMKIPLFRTIYRDRAFRLGANFAILACFSLIISLKCPILFLVFGPLILGYPHLIASYRYLRGSAGIRERGVRSPKIFAVIIGATCATILIIKLCASVERAPDLPDGLWELYVSIAVVALVNLAWTPTRQNWIAAPIAALVYLGVDRIAWHDPLMAVAGALFLHNWIAFAHWILAAKDAKSRRVAWGATLIFAFMHVIVALGWLDSMMTVSVLNPVTDRPELRKWVLAPWTADRVVWDRAVVLYTFGLSLHYFAWLRAIPQCLEPKEMPNTYKRSLSQLRADCGETAVPLLIGFIVIGTTLSLVSWPAGRAVYFSIAMLHGWLEFAFLVFTLCNFASRALIQESARGSERRSL